MDWLKLATLREVDNRTPSPMQADEIRALRAEVLKLRAAIKATMRNMEGQ